MKNTEIKIKLAFEVSSLTKVNMGLRPGDVLFPILLNLILEKVIRDTNSNNKIAFGYWNINILAYMGDTAMLGDTEEVVKQSTW